MSRISRAQSRSTRRRLRSPRAPIGLAGVGLTLIVAATAAGAAVSSPAGGVVILAAGVRTSPVCVENGFNYTSGTTVAPGQHCYATPDSSTVPRLAAVNPAKTAAQLAAVQQRSLLSPGACFVRGTMASRQIRGTALAPNSAAMAAFVASPTMSGGFNKWGVKTAINIGPGFKPDGTLSGGIGGNDNIPVYVVDSSNPAQRYATFVTTDARVTTFTKLNSVTSGKVPITPWLTPSIGGDHALTIYDQGTGILRAYYGVVKNADGTYGYRNAGYLYTNGTSLGPDNYWMSYIQGGSSVIGIANEFTQIGAEEVAAGSIDHMVSVTFPSTLKGSISFPAKGGDGTLTDTRAPSPGQVFRLPATLNIDAMALNPLEEMVAKAVQKHGGIVADKNLFSMAFNAESPLGKGPGKPNPWAPGGAAYTAVKGNYSMNNFPWARTEWVQKHNAQKLTQATYATWCPA